MARQPAPAIWELMEQGGRRDGGTMITAAGKH
jgi:hypothetical protein